MGCFVRCCRAITDKAIRATDTTEDIKTKRYGIPMGIAIMCLTSTAHLDPIDDVHDLGEILGTVACVFFLIVAFTNVMSATKVFKATLVLWLLCVYLFDWVAAARLAGGWWPFVLIIADLCLVLEYDFVTKVAVCATL
eukprot:Hpha_TRINITY_DN32816_c0_g1::TRINITY_DN32816_c0_g1_i1::g.87306::m.87306